MSHADHAGSSEEVSASQAARSTLDSEAGLRRSLTSGQIAMLGLSGALGTGLFLGSGSMIKSAGPAITVSYTLTGLLCLIVVFAMAEVTTMHPVHGGFGGSSSAYGGPFLGYMARWNTAIVLLLAVGSEIVAAATYLRFWWPNFPLWAGVLAFSAAIIAINMTAVSLYGATEYWFSWIKVIVVLAFIAVGLWLIFFGMPGADPTGFSNLWSHEGFAPMGVKGVIAGAVAAVFSFGGAENVSIAAAESENPTRDIPRAARTMILRLIIFYILAIGVVVTIRPWTETAASSGSVQESPFVAVLNAVGLPGGADFMNFILIVAALSAANGCLYSSTRMIHSLAVDEMAPKLLAKTSAHGTPRYAVGLACIGLVIAMFLSIASPDKVFMMFVGVITFGLLMTWVYITLTHILFVRTRRRLGLADSPMKLWGREKMTMFALVVEIAIAIYLAIDPGYRIAWTFGMPAMILVALLYLLVPQEAKDRGRKHNVLTEELAALGRTLD